jgi:hypothetical protein
MPDYGLTTGITVLLGRTRYHPKIVREMSSRSLRYLTNMSFDSVVGSWGTSLNISAIIIK